MTIIDLDSVGKKFSSGQEELVILDNVSLSIAEGESLTISGESGCGKSTLLNLIGGLDRPTSGQVVSCGCKVSSLPEKDLTLYRRDSVGFIFQFHYLLKDFTAIENIMMPGIMAGLGRAEARARAAKLLGAVKLEARAGHYPSQLSGGERQRISLARALVNNPRILLADEPTGNLDEGHSRAVEEILFDLVDRFGKTLILVTHDPRLAARGQRRYRLQERKLVSL
jgi:lipoprotein-releasing system ATP-binding protein